MRTKLFLLFIIVNLIYCTSDSSNSISQSTISGSYANMLAIGDNLYVLGNGSLTTLSLQNPENPVILDSLKISNDVESLFFNNNRLFIGSLEGMYIYQIALNGLPIFRSLTPYDRLFDATPCDPVVANDTIAFATLSTSIDLNNACFRNTLLNQLSVFDIKDLENPSLLTSIELEEPKGLGLDQEILFVCERWNGIKIFNVADPRNPIQLYHFDGFPALDLIPNDGLLVVIGDEDLYQFDYSNIDSVTMISTYELKD